MSKTPETPVKGVAIVVASPPDWNGELDNVHKEPWFGSIPEDVRPHVIAGLKAKHGAWQSGYQRRFSELDNEKRNASAAAHAAVADHVAGLEAKLDEAHQRLAEADRKANLYTDLFSAPPGIDPTEHDALKAEHASLQDSHGQLAREVIEWGEKFAKLQAERDEHLDWRRGREAKDREQAEQEAKTEADRFVEMNEDLLNDPDACEILHVLVDTKGMDPNEAAAKVRKLQGLPQPGTITEVPAVAKVDEQVLARPVRPKHDPLDVMSNGDSAPNGFMIARPSDGVSSDDIARAAERAARLHRQNRM